MSDAVRIEGLRKHYGAVRALDGVQREIQRLQEGERQAERRVLTVIVGVRAVANEPPAGSSMRRVANAVVSSATPVPESRSSS